MLQKWKNILTNWINCYFTESEDDEPCISLDSLLSIIAHLRENLNLDESKSAILEAHTVEEFIQEKYPEFCFENGTVEANTDEELYMVASLLLFFVCVNSKDINIKNAMCSKLSTNDQEIILKFNKCLMDCSPITYKDVQVAITDACRSTSMDAKEGSALSTVSETPPALRSLHGEVRRLQAALDAERFDRNYLQEELARTNLRVEKLSKDKEQYKLEIVNLKSKISLCCGQESESRSGDKAAEGTAKLMKELQQIEERLVQTQEQLDEALYDRDAYKTKVTELKQERDKWLALSQQEGARVIQLSEELTVERRHVQSLRELVEELRQHHQMNRLDASLVECDDPDASINSMPHNSSICSEACANVVEVQLSEERAKIILLKQQIQTLQEQLNDLTKKSETEVLSLNSIISEKDNDIFNLKHRINEEIETKNKMVIQYSDENSRLNNDINELEQKLKDCNNQYRLVLESKMQEIQTIQEEKLSLLQSLNDETTKLEDIINNLKSEVAAEKDSKLKIKEDYNNHIMKLNEKVLNRNNELVELQNVISKNGEQIESLHLELRQEKQAREEIVAKYHNELQLVNSKRMEAENMLQQKNEEIENLMDRLNNNYTYTEELNREMHLLKDSMSQLTDRCNNYEQANDSLHKEINIRDNRLDEQCKEIENFKNVLSEERDSYKKHIDDYDAKIATLSKTIEESRDEMSRQKESYTAVLESRNRDIQTLQEENQSLIDELNDMKQQLDIKVHSLEEKLTDSENLTEKLKNSYELQIENLNVMVTKLTNYLKDKTVELDSLRKDKERLQETISSNYNAIKALEEEVKSQKDNNDKFISEFESERLILKNMVTVTESVMEDQKTSLNEIIANHVKDIENLREELKSVQHRFAAEKAAAETKIKENEEIFEGIIKELSEERTAKEKLEKELENQKRLLDTEIDKLKEEIGKKESEKQFLESQNKELTAVLRKCSDEFTLLKKEKNEMVSDVKIFKEQMESMTSQLTNLESRCKDLEHDSQRSRKVIAQMREHNKNLVNEISVLKKDIDSKQKQLGELEMKNNDLEGLLQICQNDKAMIEESNKDLKIEKDLQETELLNKANNISQKLDEQVELIKKLESELEVKNRQNVGFEENLQMLSNKLETLTKDNEQLKLENDNDKEKLIELMAEMSATEQVLNNEIAKLNDENFKLLKTIEDNQAVINSFEDDMKTEKDRQEKLIHDFEYEKQVLVHKVSVSKSVIDKQKENINHMLSEHAEVCAALRKENKSLKETINSERKHLEKEIQEKDAKIATICKEMTDTRIEIDNFKTHILTEKNNLATEIEILKTEMNFRTSQMEILESQKQELSATLHQCLEDMARIEENNNEMKIKKDSQETELLNKVEVISNELNEQQAVNKKLEENVKEKEKLYSIVENKLTTLTNKLESVLNDKIQLEQKLKENESKTNEVIMKLESNTIILNKQIEILESQKQELEANLQQCKEDIARIEKNNNEIKIKKDSQETEFLNKVDDISKALNEQKAINKKLKEELEHKETLNSIIENKLSTLSNELESMLNDKMQLEQKLKENETKTNEVIIKLESSNMKLNKQIEILELQKQELSANLQECKEDIARIEENNNEIKIKKDSQETELLNKVDVISKELDEQKTINKKLEEETKEKEKLNSIIETKLSTLSNELVTLSSEKMQFEQKLRETQTKTNVIIMKLESHNMELNKQIEELTSENTKLVKSIEENNKVITSLENEVQALTETQEKNIIDFNLERQELKEKLTVSESLVEEHKVKLNNVNAEHLKANEVLKEEIKTLKETINAEKKSALQTLQDKEVVLETKIRKLYEVLNEKDNHHKILTIEKESLAEEIETLKKDITLKSTQIETLQYENKSLEEDLQKCKNDLASIEENNNELKIKLDSKETECNEKLDSIKKEYNDQIIVNKQLESAVEEKHKLTIEIEEKVRALNNQVEVLTKAYSRLEQEKNEYKQTVDDLKAQLAKDEGKTTEEICKLKEENIRLMKLAEESKKVISTLEGAVKHEKESNDFEKTNLSSKCSILQEYQIKAEKVLEERQKELAVLEEEIKTLKVKVRDNEKVLKEKDEIISSVKQELVGEKTAKEKLQIELDARVAVVAELRQKVDNVRSEEMAKALRNEEWVRAIGQRDIYAVAGSEKTGSHKQSSPLEKEYREYHHQVDNTTSDLTHSSMDSIKTISDLEKIIHDKNRTITTLQSDITYLKSLIADSENKLLDVTKELELSKENCQQLSNQLKKIVYQKNEEIAELKKQLSKMSITENRASQIIKVSAKYQAIILKRISEIKSNTVVLKELTNFGNSSNGNDNELRRSLNAGTITMEDLENFLETTDKHLRRCSEKQIALQKERDRLTEVNRINESEIINLKKFLTELSVGFKTFNNVKDLYTQKLSRVVSVQRTVRREILNLDGHINDATMCKLERGYAAVMQDLSECVMNLERWVERSISRTISPEKIKQAFSTDEDRASLASTTFQNASLEVQLEELENSFQKLLEEAVRAQKGEGARDAQSVTVMEVRAEYEDKLNRMKAKMKQLYQEQISVFKEKQRDEISVLERELSKTREKLAESSKAYEEHIRALTTELWRVGEKFLSKKDELEWERKKQRSGSLMSLQHVHSSGLVPPRDESARMSDAHSLRSLPVNNNTNKKEGRGLHMSDEEGEVFDNRWLKELSATPRRRDAGSPERLSELRWRNSLCPPHLKSSYPAETQFAPAIDEEDIKYTGAVSLGGRNQRKEVGITAYKKPGPPTPSKQAGRLSATDSELRESLRPEPEPHMSRKTSTPSRLRSLFRSNKNDTGEGTPRSRRLSIFRKK